MAEKVTIIYNVIDKASTKLGRIASSVKNVGTSSGTASGEMTGLGGAAQAAGGLITAYIGIQATRAVVDFAKASVAAFADFEYAMAGVAAKLGTTLGDITELSETAKRVGMEYGIGAKEAAGGLVALAAAGFDAAESAIALDAAAKLSIISGIGMEQSAILIVRALSVFGAEADDAARYVDVLVAADLASTAAAGDLGVALGYAGASAKSMGLDVYEALTAISILADRVGGATKAGRYFDALLRELRVKSEDLGIEIYTTDGRLRDFGDILVDVSRKMEGLTTEQKNAWLTSVGFSSQALRAMLALSDVGDSAEDAAELWAKYSDSVNESGRASEAVSTMMDTLTGATNEFKAAVEGLQITLMEGLSPSLTTIYDDLTGIVGAFTKAADMINKLSGWRKENIAPSWFLEPAKYKQWEKDLKSFMTKVFFAELSTMVTIGEAAADEMSDIGKEIGEGLIEPLESAIDEINRLISQGLLGDAQGKFADFTHCVTDKAGQMALDMQDHIWDMIVSTEEGYARLLAMAEQMPEGAGRQAAIQRAETYRAAGYERIEDLESILNTLLTTGTIPTATTDPTIPVSDGDVVIDTLPVSGGDVIIDMDINMIGIDPDNIDYNEMSRTISEDLLSKLIDAGVIGNYP